MKSIEIKVIGDDGFDVATDGRAAYQIRVEADRFILTDVRPKADKDNKAPKNFASSSGAVNYAVHALMELV